MVKALYLLPLFSLALLPQVVARGATFLYVSQAPEKTIRIYRVDSQTGALTEVDALAVDGGPGCLSVDPQRKFLYASLRTTNRLASFRIDPATGKLAPLNHVELSPGANAAFVRTDRSGKFLVSASYAAGLVVVHAVEPDGRIKSPALQTVETAKTAHCVTFDATNLFVFVPHVAPNAVYQFLFDEREGRLLEAKPAPGGAEKAGPRHIAIHPSHRFAFTSDETGSSVTLYSLTAEELAPLKTLSTLPADFAAKNTTAEVKIHPSGNFVWVSNRGHDSLAGFRFDAATGALEAIGQTPTEKTPRSFDIEPSGRFLYSAGEGSGKLAAYTIDADTGKLNRFATYDVGQSLSWVLAVDVP